MMPEKRRQFVVYIEVPRHSAGMSTLTVVEDTTAYQNLTAEEAIRQAAAEAFREFDNARGYAFELKQPLLIVGAGIQVDTREPRK